MSTFRFSRYRDQVGWRHLGSICTFRSFGAGVVKIVFALMLIMIALMQPVLAEQRYQAVPLNPGYEFGTEKAFLLDTLAGHMWIWVESPSIGDKSGGRYLIYQGQLQPGKSVGEIIHQQQWSGNTSP